VRVSRDGTVSAQLPDGAGFETIGRIEVFQFSNPDGLQAVGNAFVPTEASGEPQAASAALYPGTVQGSNVNLAAEETNLLIDRRAFEANVNAFRAQADVLGYLLNIRE
jgi:flagellar basal-body rod protein FlgG